MRKFFGIVIFFFALAFSLLLNSSANQPLMNYASDSIQIKKEVVELVSNTILDNKTTSYKENSNKNNSNSTPLALSCNRLNCLQGANRAQYITCSICGQASEKQKIHQIRAP